ncbi:uncharacterized protein LOC143593364 [Bidens hawaiensis]|uniref:uncharacterized protein LOC143593364 n=1 Tax=Bidens hawaiensis TaxID=980011 RepID=UPI00404B7375
MKRCVLCKSTARIYCESDRASLCWSCDAKVHSANFLVARHSRSLLCQICQSETLWSSSGEKLCRSAAATCRTCVVEDVSEKGNKDEIGSSEGDEIDNQAVPPASSSSSSEDGGCLLNRKRHNVEDNSIEDEIRSSSVSINHHTSSSTVSGSVKKLRDRNKSRRTVDIDLNLSAIE